jgi:SAM-dependent methyltransferase
MGSVAKLKFTEAKAEPKLLRVDFGSFVVPEGFVVKGFNSLKNDSVDEGNCNYVLHLSKMHERVHFFNELYRVLKPGAKCRIDVPYWCSAKAYGDPRVQWPPVTEYFFPMLSKAYRDQQRDPNSIGLTCNFDHTLGYGMHPMIATRNQEYQQHAVSFWKEAAQELIATVTKPE